MNEVQEKTYLCRWCGAHVVAHSKNERASIKGLAVYWYLQTNDNLQSVANPVLQATLDDLSTDGALLLGPFTADKPLYLAVL